MIARLGLSPLQAEAQQLFHNVAALAFTDYWQREVEEARYKRFGKILGVYWTIDDAAALFSPDTVGYKQRPTEAWFPYSFIAQPETEKMVKSFFGSPRGIDSPAWTRQRGEDIIEGIDMDREKFKQFAGMFTHLIPKK